jgi:C4-dicarboxylate transporter, DctM subunit
MQTLPRLAPFLILILIVMVALYGGWATPSEVAGIGAFGALVMVMLIYGCWRWADLKVILSATARESSMIMLIIAMSFLYTYVMSYLHVTQDLAQWIVSLGMGKWQFFFWTCIFLIVPRVLSAAGGDHLDGDPDHIARARGPRD